MFRRKRTKKTYDKEHQIPVIRASICNGEQVAGFKNMQSGKFTEVMAIRNRSDLNMFLEEYGVEETEIKKEW
ncbi:MAG: aspartate dehydrogenase [Lachnospiraceae bacterium]|nr:aspartate dehydrogenase [Lachnospiraceae bacterium]